MPTGPQTPPETINPRPIAQLGVSRLSLGAAGLGTELNQDESGRLLDAYFELGGNFLDSAHVYACWVPDGEGISERTIGAWMRSRGIREQIKISTKGGHPPIDGYPHASKFLSPEAIAEDVSESLDRLGTEFIDLYYLHRDDGQTPVEEIIDALNDIESLRWLGASNWSVERVAEANAYAHRAQKRGFVSLQNQWSLAIPSWIPSEDPTMRFITDLDSRWCAGNGVMIHAYSSTANGYFARAANEGSFAANRELHARVQTLASDLGRSPTQIALAWLLNQPLEVVPILGTTKIERLREAFKALDLVLDDQARTLLRG